MISIYTHNKERGAVSMITAILLSLLLTIIVTGFITLMVSEVRQSNDAEQSIRAYYAAQSGVEDAVQYVIQELQDGPPYTAQTCTDLLSKNLQITSGIPVGWTCQNISFTGKPADNLDQSDKAITIDLAGADPFAYVDLSWDVEDRSTTPGPYNMSVPLPASSAWSGAPAMEMTVVDYNPGSVSQMTINTHNILIIPSLAAGPQASFNSSGSNPYRGTCNPSTTVKYHCTARINNDLGGRSLLLRLRSRYQPTRFEMVFRTAGGAVVPIPDGYATIDVTAKAGDVFRRVIYKVPITNGATTGLDYVLFADGSNICKNYTIVETDVIGSYPCN